MILPYFLCHRFGCCTDSDAAAEGPLDKGCPDQQEPTEPPSVDGGEMEEEMDKNCTQTEWVASSVYLTTAYLYSVFLHSAVVGVTPFL